MSDVREPPPATRPRVNLFNILTVMTLGLAAVACLAFTVLAVAPGQLSGTFLGSLAGETLPTPAVAAVAPTLTPTITPSLTPVPVEPTWTLPAGGPAAAQAATNTRSPTLTPSVTLTFPPPTPTPTPTRTPTPTPTPTETYTPGPPPTPTVTQSPYPFTKSDDSPLHVPNFANDAGCNWLGLAGEVLDLNGNPVAVGSYRVHVWESGIEARLTVGSAPAYGPSGWEQFVLDAPAVRDYNVQLESPNGTPVSEVYHVQTWASCRQNLLLFHFVQNH